MSVEQAGSKGFQESDSGGVYRPEFPTARYFQIHFEYIEELLTEARQCVEALQQQVAHFQGNGDDDPVEQSGRQARKPSCAGPKQSLQCVASPARRPVRDCPCFARCPENEGLLASRKPAVQRAQRHTHQGG
jgi:hypothetical protein